ncbi:isochorismatase family protein [Byssothecium circinans]|uniref:Isochorismatase family protein n=1 Tax=Byssothecium circinans TaxID=147558 RepID=A0A6A5TNU3_9PLEO|nr:isochorismatase family protein [Byssothecium circinans]
MVLHRAGFNGRRGARTLAGRHWPKNERVIIGTADNFRIRSSEEGWDLTHPTKPETGITTPRVPLDCEISNVVIDPTKTALVIIDKQNISLSVSFCPAPSMRAAEEALLLHAIPAARKLGIQVVRLNWGLTEEELKAMTPVELRVFGFKANSDRADYGLSESEGDRSDPEKFLRCRERPQLRSMLGADLGKVQLEDGSEVEAGRKMMRGTWNAELHQPLLEAFETGKKTSNPDVFIHKSKNSGFVNSTLGLEEYLRTNGIRTLLFSGINTDQGFDTIMLKDACATDSPEYAQEAAEYKLCRNWGFLSSCKALAKAAECWKGK